MSGDICLIGGCPHYLQNKVANCPRCTYCAKCATTLNVSAVHIESKPIWAPLHQKSCVDCGQFKMVDSLDLCYFCHSENYKKAFRVVSLCASCQESYVKTCKKCKEPTDVYAEKTLQCPTCFYGDDFKIASSKVKKCKDCNTVDHVNKQGRCKNCHVELSMAEAQNDDWGNTKICPKCRKVTKKGNKYCSACVDTMSNILTCKGCLSKFKGISKYDTFCIKCKEDLERGRCTMCGKMSKKASSNERGWCGSCLNDVTP